MPLPSPDPPTLRLHCLLIAIGPLFLPEPRKIMDRRWLQNHLFTPGKNVNCLYKCIQAVQSQQLYHTNGTNHISLILNLVFLSKMNRASFIHLFLHLLIVFCSSPNNLTLGNNLNNRREFQEHTFRIWVRKSFCRNPLSDRFEYNQILIC